MFVYLFTVVVYTFVYCCCLLVLFVFYFNIPLPPPHPHPRLSQLRPPRNLSLEQRDPHGPRRILPLPYPLLHTSGRKRAWRTSDRICDQDEPRPRRWRWCCSTCRWPSVPWPNHRREQRWVAGS